MERSIEVNGRTNGRTFGKRTGRLTPRVLMSEVAKTAGIISELGRYAGRMERWHRKQEDGNGASDPIQSMTFKAMEGLDRIRKSLVNREPREPMMLPNGTMLSFGDNSGRFVQGELF